MAGRLSRLLGLTGRVEATQESSGADPALVDWFNRTYSLVWGNESSREKAQRMLDSSFLTWLRLHRHLAFEVSDGQFVVWSPGRVVDSTARDELVSEARERAAKAHLGGDSRPPSVRFVPPAVTTAQGIMWRMAISGIRAYRGDVEAVELEMILVTRQPEEIFAAEDRRERDDWVEFFSRTREADERRKGVVEVEL
jgi:hypothetical protein